jgi:cytochrome oxidase assembly protein ShyY1
VKHWPGHLLLVVALVAAGLLGWWQYSAWAAEREHAARDLSNAPAKALADTFGPDDTFPGRDLGRRVEFEGDWMPESTLFISDRKHDGRTGYWVMTPVTVGDAAMPVVRGWTEEPEAPDVSGPVAVEGWLQAGEGETRADPDPDDDVIAAVRIASITQYVDRDLYSGYVVAVSPTPGLAAVPADAVPPVSSNTALRNLMYALQWLIFGGFAAFIWWKWFTDQRVDSQA